MMDLFSIPLTDLSILSNQMVTIQTFTTGCNSVEFQADPQEDYMDLSLSFFEIEFALKLANSGVKKEVTHC